MNENRQRDLYENEWSSIQLAPELGETGWKTAVPAPDFAKFTTYLDKNHITGTALDLGCGGGRYTIALAKAGLKASGIDFSESAIKQAVENARNSSLGDQIDFRVGDVLDLPYSNSSFDVINDDGCLHHIEPQDWELYRENITRVLKPGGLVRLKAFSASSEYRGENSSVFTHFFTKGEIRKVMGDGFDEIELAENDHPKTPKKKFFFALYKKRP